MNHKPNYVVYLCIITSAFLATWVMKLGGVTSLTLFNFIVDNVIWTWLALTVEDHQAVINGLGENIGNCLLVVYADDGMFAYRDSEWLQHSMNVLIGFFWRYGLADNVSKPCTLTCQPGAMRSGISEEAKQLK